MTDHWNKLTQILTETANHEPNLEQMDALNDCLKFISKEGEIAIKIATQTIEMMSNRVIEAPKMEHLESVSFGAFGCLLALFIKTQSNEFIPHTLGRVFDALQTRFYHSKRVYPEECIVKWLWDQTRSIYSIRPFVMDYTRLWLQSGNLETLAGHENGLAFLVQMDAFVLWMNPVNDTVWNAFVVLSLSSLEFSSTALSCLRKWLPDLPRHYSKMANIVLESIVRGQILSDDWLPFVSKVLSRILTELEHFKVNADGLVADLELLLMLQTSNDKVNSMILKKVLFVEALEMVFDSDCEYLKSLVAHLFSGVIRYLTLHNELLWMKSPRIPIQECLKSVSNALKTLGGSQKVLAYCSWLSAYLEYKEMTHAPLEESQEFLELYAELWYGLRTCLNSHRLSFAGASDESVFSAASVTMEWILKTFHHTPFGYDMVEDWSCFCLSLMMRQVQSLSGSSENAAKLQWRLRVILSHLSFKPSWMNLWVDQTKFKITLDLFLTKIESWPMPMNAPLLQLIRNLCLVCEFHDLLERLKDFKVDSSGPTRYHTIVIPSKENVDATEILVISDDC